MNLTECPTCGSKSIKSVKGIIKRCVQRKDINIPNVTYWHCSECKEKIFSPDTMKSMEDFIRKKIKSDSRNLKNAQLQNH